MSPKEEDTSHSSASKRMKEARSSYATPPTKMVHVEGASMTDQVLYTLHPQTNTLVRIRRDQLWFWSPEWQAGEREVDRDLESGDYEDFESIDDFIASL